MRYGKQFLVLLLQILSLLVPSEFIARLAFTIPAVSRRLHGGDDASRRREWVRRHKHGAELHYSFDAYDRTKGWVSKPGLRDAQVFNGKVLNTNARGLRGRREHRYGELPGKSRIVILGDSFTFGEEVSDDETYPHYLQEMLPAAEIINMGVHGYGHDQMLLLLREEGVKYRPDLVILGFVYVDSHRNLLRFRDFAKPRFIVEGDRLELVGIPVPRPEEILGWDWAKPRLYDVWSLASFRLRELNGSYERELTEVTTAILDSIVATSRSVGAVPIFPRGPCSRRTRDDR